MQAEPTSALDPQKQAVELRTGLEEFFGQDVFVGIRVTRSRLRGDPDFAQATVDALSRNSDDLSTLLGRVYGTANRTCLLIERILLVSDRRCPQFT